MEFQPRLSPELWTIVFQMLSGRSDWPPRIDSDIGNLRLTCRLFENLATPFLLPRISCGPLSSSLTRLTAVSCHPVLSRSVKEVVFICNQYQFIKTLPEYKEALCRAGSLSSRKFEEPESEEENLDLETAFSQYGQHFDDQTAMENSGEVIARLCSALMRMPNVKKITVSPNFVCFLDCYDYSRYFLEPEPAYNEAFLLMARVLSLTGAKIRELSVESDDTVCGDYYGVDGAVFRGMSPMDLSHCCNAFRGLREATITADEYDIDGWMTGNMAKILSVATNLESLWFGSRSQFRISLKYIFSTTTWNRLTSLNFSWITFDQGELLDLLRRHSGTLKKIDLLCVTLTNGSWRILLEGMKSSLSLEAISIDDPCEEDDEGVMIDKYVRQAALEDYLLGDGPHPLPNNVP
ncbi:hypothetical protein GP486_006862 [Trichoglossum hirsutum]|uniref:F-box domain-containing protein n=1 Tax=Trichoglossum hirsutum TaxID=265104 RepID=A0A9P8ICY4_9PEZI|nr:hypothetical protein GP486_006862 [Trichoglossum hirsutum]